MHLLELVEIENLTRNRDRDQDKQIRGDQNRDRRLKMSLD